MHPQSIELEKFRQKIEKIEYEIGSLSDYLDLGKPNEKQKQTTQAAIAKLGTQSQELSAQFHDLIVSIRASEPKAIEQWVQWHQGVCERIIAEPVHNRKSSTRQFVARGTLNQWFQVLRGEKEIVLINWSFLPDYIKHAKEFFQNRILT